METPFGCSLCAAKIRTRTGLKIHMKKVHPDYVSSSEVVAELNALSDCAMIGGLYAPFMCPMCGFCCTSKQGLSSHQATVHPRSRRRRKSSPKGEARRPVFADRKITDLRTLAATVESRAQESFSGELPPFCCTDDSGTPRAVYVPIYLTKAESELLLQLSFDRHNLAPAQSEGQGVPRERLLSNDVDEAFLAAEDLIRSETLQKPPVKLEPEPVDMKTLNAVFELVCNDAKLSDSPKPEHRTFVVSEEMLKKIDLESDKAEVFEFDGDFEALSDRDICLYDVGDTVEIHVTQPDGSITVMNAVRRTDAQLESLPSAEYHPEPQANQGY